MRVLIVGCGYVGLPLAETLARNGHVVFGLRRSAEADVPLRAAGVVPLHGDVSQPETLRALPTGFDWVVNCAATRGGGPEDYEQLYLRGNLNLMEWLRASPPQKFVFTSSTGVYGQDDGSWVTEESPAEPASATARVLVEAERALLAAAREGRLPAVILRVAGIYGPGRGYWLRQFLSGAARLEGDGGRALNMIHRDDLIAAILVALERGRPGEIYNVVDDEPVTQREFFEWLAGQTGQQQPDEQPSERPVPVIADLSAPWRLIPGIELMDWQRECVDAWFAHGFRGTVKVVTGAGKTILALAATEKLQNEYCPELRVTMCSNH
jgi:nucleoside-diphosphate-sugar epimerase